MTDVGLLLSISLPVVGVLLGFLVARRTGPTVTRNRELEGEIEVLRRQSERAWAENQTLKDDLQQAREAGEGYKQKVVEHFYGTSDQLRDLTLQYRAVVDQLAEGARKLCPDEFSALSGGLEPPALSGDLKAASDAEVTIEVDEPGATAGQEAAAAEAAANDADALAGREASKPPVAPGLANAGFAKPATAETAKPATAETAEPAPAETAMPTPAQTAKPAPTQTAKPAPTQSADTAEADRP